MAIDPLNPQANDSQKRLLLAVGISFAITFLYSQFFLKPPELGADAGSADGGVAQVQALDAGAVELAVIAAADGDAGATAAAAPLPLRDDITFTKSTTKLVFSTEGGGVTQAELLGAREREQEDVSVAEGWGRLFGRERFTPPQMNLIRPKPGAALPLSVGIAGAITPTARAEVLSQEAGAITFRSTGGGYALTRRYSWADDGYGVNVEVTVKNLRDAQAAGELLLTTSRDIAPGSEHSSSMFGGIGNEAQTLCRVNEDIHRKTPSDKPPEAFPGKVSFFGIDQQYFLSALYPVGAPLEGRCQLTASVTARIAEGFFPFTLGPLAQQEFKFAAFLGPKDHDLLVALDESQAKTATVAGHPALEKSVDFGWWAAICKVLLVVLKFFHQLTGNWGVGVILLTVLVKVLLLPLTHRAMVSAEQMKGLGPQIEALKKKFPDDKNAQNAEMMKLYQQAGVNPLGGCLPLLLQLPIWAALFTTLRTSYDLYGEPFFGPVWTDLTSKDPTYILPFALGITMIITQRLQPQMMDQSQAFMFTWVMPIFFTAIMMNYPAGLALYIFTNNLLSIVQQYLLRKYLAKTGQAAPKPKVA
jgi:YidC/Oxa1 family membrane protein insertase